jgi:hypothetical protein
VPNSVELGLDAVFFFLGLALADEPFAQGRGRAAGFRFWRCDATGSVIEAGEGVSGVVLPA